MTVGFLFLALCFLGAALAQISRWPFGDRLVWSATMGNIRFGDDGSCYVFDPPPNAGIWLAAYAATSWPQSLAMATVSALLSVAVYRLKDSKAIRIVGSVAIIVAVGYTAVLLAQYDNGLARTSTASTGFQGALPMPLWARTLFTLRLVLDPMYTGSLFLSICLAGLALRAIGRSVTLAEGHCGKCGYNLTGNVSGICPECGTSVKLDRGRREDPL